eukprot:CAMPEP_0198591332 /NCGR_PEP_ID=MMETSP1462-20131121/136753_1 /TAXON_ID=1333877 /ORGANISM="Brandtodinium nutriculum, Strain RCC3387" /LENGTH=160 /DNA_ID=CAMNT_0044322891 /DNA_START=41 /DNA_END=519 /DNA_ORIENTATION=-
MLIVTPTLTVSNHDAMLGSSADYGAYLLQVAASDAAKGLADSHARVELEVQLLTYIYTHILCNHPLCLSGSLSTLSYLGYRVSGGAATPPDLRIQALAEEAARWDGVLPGDGFVTGALDDDTKAQVTQPWSTRCETGDAQFIGVSLVPNQPCPWDALRYT